MKKCTKCKEEKSLGEFNKNKSRSDGHANMCRECWKIYYAEYYKSGKEKERLARQRKAEKLKVREYIAEVKSVPCMDCGNSYPSYVMDFDHRDPSIKLFTIAKVSSTKSLIRIKEEIEKCDVVCSNCHRLRTHMV